MIEEEQKVPQNAGQDQPDNALVPLNPLEDPRYQLEGDLNRDDEQEENAEEDDLFRINHSKRLFFDEYGAKVVEGNFVIHQDGENYTLKCQWVS